MAESRDDPGYSWYRPHQRGIIPIGGFHISRSLRAFAKKEAGALRFGYDQNFEAVIDACAARKETWINPVIKDAFMLLHQNQHAHSFEVYHSGALMGGVYGLALGGAFFGESMFSNQSNGSKLALAALVNDLGARGFALFDTQFLTSHLASLGGVEIAQSEYMKQLTPALELAPQTIEKGKIDAMKYFTQR